MSIIKLFRSLSIYASSQQLDFSSCIGIIHGTLDQNIQNMKKTGDAIRILCILGGTRRHVGEKGFDGRVLCGPESQAIDMCSNLDRGRFETIIVYSKGGRLRREFENIGIQVEQFDTKSKFNLAEVLYLYRLIKVNDIDVLQTHGPRVDFFGAIAAKLAGIPHIITRHVAISQHLLSNFRKKLYASFDNIAMKWAAKVITVSHVVEDDLVENQGVVRDKIVTIVNGVDLNRFSMIDKKASIKIRSEFGIDAGMHVVGMIAQLSYWKGVAYFLSAIPSILSRCKYARFLIIGDGPERANLEALAERLGISQQVIFGGFRRDIPEIIASMDIVVLSSLREGLPLVLLESMAMGKPVVATNVGGVSELVQDGETGFIIAPRSPDTLAEAVTILLASAQRAREFGRAGRHRVEQYFSFDQMLKKYEEVYKLVVGKPSKT